MENNNESKSIYDFMQEAGVELPQLVEAGLELLAGVEKNEELEFRLEKQIRKSLEDINVVVLIMAGIRVEEDLLYHRIEGVDVDDDPAYLYTDEVLGMAIANQIAGTKAIFNFKRYDEAKPGIIATLGPMLDDVFAGLVAGCMSKIFEE
jgi:alpha-ribazole phosphatase CobZ